MFTKRCSWLIHTQNMDFAGTSWIEECFWLYLIFGIGQMRWKCSVWERSRLSFWTRMDGFGGARAHSIVCELQSVTHRLNKHQNIMYTKRIFDENSRIATNANVFPYFRNWVSFKMMVANIGMFERAYQVCKFISFHPHHSHNTHPTMRRQTNCNNLPPVNLCQVCRL